MEVTIMSKRGRRVRTPRGPHKDRYANLAGVARDQLAAFNEKWEKTHPAVEPTADTSETTEEEECA
jgi:hypothetical protein